MREARIRPARRAARALLTTAVALGLAATLAPGSAAATLPSHSSQATQCSTGTPNFEMRPPTMYGFDTGAGRDWGYVAWRPHVWYWTGERWAHVAQGPWLWSWAFDDTPSQYWYGFDGNYLGTASSFAVTYSVRADGYWYAVSDEFYWYASGGAAAAYDHRWVDSYSGNAFVQGFCLF